VFKKAGFSSYTEPQREKAEGRDYGICLGRWNCRLGFDHRAFNFGGYPAYCLSVSSPLCSYFDVSGKKEDVPMCNMKKVVSLERRCPETAFDDVVKCLAERLDVKKLFASAGLPAAAAVLMALTSGDASLFALADSLCLWSLAYAVWTAARGGSICRGDAWRLVCPALAAGFLIAVAVHGYVIQTHGSCSTSFQLSTYLRLSHI
jgi:hypothetical protein